MECFTNLGVILVQGHANLCIVTILYMFIYVLLKQAQYFYPSGIYGAEFKVCIPTQTSPKVSIVALTPLHQYFFPHV